MATVRLVVVLFGNKGFLGHLCRRGIREIIRFLCVYFEYLQIMSVPNLLDIPYDDPTVMMETKKLPPLQVPSKEAKTQKSNPLNPSECYF